MINFIIDDKILMKREALYTIFFLTENCEEEIKLSKEPIEDEGAVNIFYGLKPTCKGSLYIPYLEEKYPQKHITFNKYKDEVFINFGEEVLEPYKIIEGNIEFNYDIISTSFYLISCGEEKDINTRDGMNRFLGEYSLRRKYIHIPFFDVNAQILYTAMKEINKELKLKEKKFEVMLTHDVDSVNSRNIYVFLHNLKELLLNKDKPFKTKLGDLIKDIIYNRHLQYENYIKIESARGTGSEFYFIEGVKHRLGKRYNLSQIKKQINLLKNNSKYVIGLHTNYFSYDNSKAIKDEISSIEKYVGNKVISSRNHYLRFEFPKSLKLLREAGILCDCTLGYSDKNGFRAAISKSFLPYDMDEKDIIDIYEVPMIVMDGVLMNKNSSMEENWLEIKVLIDEVIKYRGTVSILWHDRVIYDEEYKALYEKILDYIKQMNGRFVLSHELLDRMKEQRRKIKELFEQLT